MTPDLKKMADGALEKYGDSRGCCDFACDFRAALCAICGVSYYGPHLCTQAGSQPAPARGKEET
jgi:hypothetical protein